MKNCGTFFGSRQYQQTNLGKKFSDIFSLRSKTQVILKTCKRCFRYLLGVSFGAPKKTKLVYLAAQLTPIGVLYLFLQVANRVLPTVCW